MTYVTFPWAAVATFAVCCVGLFITILTTTWKLSKLLAPIQYISQQLNDLNVKVGIQNGRISRLEEWKELIMELKLRDIKHDTTRV